MTKPHKPSSRVSRRIPSLFGTDGIRGRAGRAPLDRPSLLRLGAVLAEVFAGKKLLIGRDTRESGPFLEETLLSVLSPACRVLSAGVVSTPALAYLTRRHAMDAGIMLSASHNPFADNGIKLFGARGGKLSLRLEREISRRFADQQEPPQAAPPPPIVESVPPAAYLRFLQSHRPSAAEFPGRIVIDCANGSASALAPAVFSESGWDARFLFHQPDGRNINEDCGATATAALQEAVVHERAELGIAFDGDADRAIFVDRRGRVMDGDFTLFLLARHFRATTADFPPLVVGTVMSNLGLEETLQRENIRFLRAAVGDKHVSAEMRRCGAVLGGEPSGHTILRRFQPTGDGLLTALYVVRALGRLGRPSDEINDLLPRYPHADINLPVREKRDIATWPELQALTAEFERRHGGNSRLLVRYSGTEMKIRLMVESADPNVVRTALSPIEAEIIHKIGVPS